MMHFEGSSQTSESRPYTTCPWLCPWCGSPAGVGQCLIHLIAFESLACLRTQVCLLAWPCIAEGGEMRAGDSALRGDSLAAKAAVPCQGLCCCWCCFCMAQPCQAPEPPPWPVSSFPSDSKGLLATCPACFISAP